MHVFIRVGQFITSFGKGHIRAPHRKTVDSEGFVYVFHDKLTNLPLCFNFYIIL